MNSGWHHTEEAKEKIGAASRGRVCTQGCTCWKHSETTRLKQSVAAKKRPRGKCPPSCTCGRHVTRTCGTNCACGRHTISPTAQKNWEVAMANRSPEAERKRREASRRAMTGNKFRQGVPLSPEHKAALLEGIKRAWSDDKFGDKHPCWGRPGYHGATRMRCLNSEGVFALDCESVGITWEYEPKRFKLSWCTYKPDFYLPEFDIWVEVKGYENMPGNWQKKVDTFRRETGKTLVVVFQKELSAMTYGGG